MDSNSLPETSQSSPVRTKRPLGLIGEMIKVALISLAIILPVRYFLIKPFYVNGASMEPNYYDHEYLIIDEISYRFNAPMRGDVVVFRYPGDPKQYFIKRVIGLPGEQIVLKDNKITIYNSTHQDGIKVDEPYLASDEVTAGELDKTLGVDEYFVFGDNRHASLDSRRFGPIHKSAIVGRTWLRGWPLDRVGVLIHHDFSF